jgi:penicillin amidase/acyl-homoserine-lactone acylase
VKLFGRLRWTVRRELLRSAHGPVIRQPHGTYALRFAGAGELRHLEQYLRMNRAQSFGEWQDALRMQAIPSVNFVYADRSGNVAYFYNAKFPKRAPGFDWQGVLPGDRSELIWHETLPFDAVPGGARFGLNGETNHAVPLERPPTRRPWRASRLSGHRVAHDEPRLRSRAVRRDA